MTWWYGESKVGAKVYVIAVHQEGHALRFVGDPELYGDSHGPGPGLTTATHALKFNTREEATAHCRKHWSTMGTVLALQVTTYYRWRP